MKLQNSYIFLKNQSKEREKEKNGNVIYINIPSRVSSYITKSFPGAVNHDDENNVGFCQQKLVWKKEDSKACCSVEFRVNEVVGVTYLDVIVEGKNKIQIIKCLELIQNTLHESGIQSEYIMIVSYDAISEYYCSKIYPMLNKLERNLRKLLFNIYIVNFEKEYYRATISEELQKQMVLFEQGATQHKKKLSGCKSSFTLLSLMIFKKCSSLQVGQSMIFVLKTSSYPIMVICHSYLTKN